MSTAVIVCGILREEITAILREQGAEGDILALAPAPCIDYAVLRRQLERALRRAKARADRVLVVIGLCHPDIDQILGHQGAARLDLRDCFEALLGREERRRLDREANTFYTLASWLPHWRRALSKGMRWDEVDARQNFGHYERVLLLDTGCHKIADEDVLAFFDFTGVPVEIRPVGLDNLRRLLAEALAKQAV